MSSLARWSYEHGPATLWPSLGLDKGGSQQFGLPVLIPAVSYSFGGEAAQDANGVEFMPRSTFYFEGFRTDPYAPKLEWLILFGDYLTNETPPKEAEPIRSITYWPMDEFGPEIPDWKVMTS